jgi:hypothetical protein
VCKNPALARVFVTLDILLYNQFRRVRHTAGTQKFLRAMKTFHADVAVTFTAENKDAAHKIINDLSGNFTRVIIHCTIKPPASAPRTSQYWHKVLRLEVLGVMNPMYAKQEAVPLGAECTEGQPIVISRKSYYLNKTII